MGKLLVVIARDAVALIGLALIVWGAASIYAPAGLIAGGAILVAAAVMASRAG